MRHGPHPHTHPCRRCKAPVECGGELERNFDGFPETICRAYHNVHTGGIAEVWCEGCFTKAFAEALADEQENA